MGRFPKLRKKQDVVGLIVNFKSRKLRPVPEDKAVLALLMYTSQEHNQYPQSFEMVKDPAGGIKFSEFM